ncbi:MAG: sigma-54-dependent transcriptional regulator [Sandaracinaceae bacterium]
MSVLGQVLVVDDDDSFRFAMKKALRRQGYDVLEADGGRAALPLLNASEPPDAALLDLRMPDLDGLGVLRRTNQTSTRIVVLTGHGSVAHAVEAMKLGAFSFLEKPVDAEVLSPLLNQAIHEARAQRSGETEFAPPLIGVSAAMDEVRAFIVQVGPTDETVLISGETGTGKEVVARRLHLSSVRAGGPFIALNAACVPHELFESELFGHARGAFTGATADRAGLFRDANGGTLFIDELAELPLDSQAKLLRALETRTIRPVGGAKEHEVDVRIVAATNRDLRAQVEAGQFREDLYFRLQVFPIVLPPLRERADDVGPLATHLLSRLGGVSHELSPGALDALRAHAWPGNVRELLNVLRRASLFASGSIIDGPLVRKMLAASVFAQPGQTRTAPEEPTEEPLPLAEVERRHIERTLARFDGNITKAATSLGIDRRTLQRKLKSYDA